MNNYLFFIALTLTCSFTTLTFDDLSFIKVNLPVTTENTTDLNITTTDLNTTAQIIDPATILSTNTTTITPTQPSEAENLAITHLANASPVDSIIIANTTITNTVQPSPPVENCDIDNEYAKKLSDIDNEISNLRILFMNTIISKIGLPKTDQAFLDPINDPHELIQQYLLNFEVVQGKLNILKSDVMLYNKEACGKIFFMLFNTENLLNNLYYILEEEKFQLS
jgi:hypothetical protein